MARLFEEDSELKEAGRRLKELQQKEQQLKKRVQERQEEIRAACPHKNVGYSPTGDDVCRDCGEVW